jgi:uncharacterized protein (TIGR02996 family)
VIVAATTWVEFSSDGAFLAIGRADGGTVIWDMRRGGVVATIGEVGAHVHFARWRPDRKRIAVGYSDGIIDVFSTDGFTKIATLDGRADGILRALAYHPDGSMLLSIGLKGEGVRIWRDDGTMSIAAIEHGDARTTLLVSRDFLAAGWSNGDVSIWSPRGDDYVREGNLRASSRQVISGAISPSGTIAAFGTETGGGVGLFRAGEWKNCGYVRVPRPMAASALAFSPNGQHLAAACSDGVARIVKLGPLALAPDDPELALLANIQTDKNPTALITYADWLDQRGRTYEAAYLRLRVKGDSRGMLDAALFLCQPWIASLDAPYQAPSVHDDETVGTLKWNKDWSREAILSGVAFTPDGRLLVTSQLDGTVRFYRADRFWPRAGTLRLALDGWTFEASGETRSAPSCDLWQRVMS